MSSRNYAYLRVSSRDQNPDSQLDAINNLNVEIDERDIYIDKESGKNFDCAEWQALKRSIRAMDCAYITELDRLGRNKAGINGEWK
ncbi:recombinase family protein [Clostridium sp.]|uniref:recombinase family protein n=1 Tax=Clostridium sp. TaxID=1506 RepID=UPI002586A08F|nr:recombinase family protein [Clostridium sp.]MDF2505237.1 recombinase family protein [Clostridium sp.]